MTATSALRARLATATSPRTPASPARVFEDLGAEPTAETVERAARPWSEIAARPGWRWPHLRPEELACSCCDRVWMDERALDRFEQLRRARGDYLIVTCAYRCRTKNASLAGAAKKSQHLLGRAFDISMQNQDPHAFEADASRIFGGGIGIYPPTPTGRRNFIHVDIGPKRRWAEHGEFQRVAAGASPYDADRDGREAEAREASARKAAAAAQPARDGVIGVGSAGAFAILAQITGLDAEQLLDMLARFGAPTVIALAAAAAAIVYRREALQWLLSWRS